MRWDLEDLVSSADIADLIGVTAPAISNWKNRYSDFPLPLTRVARGKTELYSKREVIAWYTRNMSEEMREILRR